MSAPASTTKLFGIVAARAPVAVIFRRGPARHVRLIRWDLDTDSITCGQWLIGRVHTEVCGLSPDGKLLVYYARKGGRRFTALSRPPYFTALAFWENGSPWIAGGFLPDDRTLVLGVKYAQPREAGRIPKDFEITDVWDYFWKGKPFTTWADVVPGAPEANHGFALVEPGTYQKQDPAGSGRAVRRTPLGRARIAYHLVADDGAAVDLDTEWADWAPDGSLLLGNEGRLYRARASAAGGLDGRPHCVADLRAQAFEHIAPTEEALEWPGRRGARGRGKRKG